MVKVRKKPVVIEAVQYFPNQDYDCVEYDSNGAHIKTKEGRMRIKPGDWIMTGVKGESYPCDREIFEETYEILEATE